MEEPANLTLFSEAGHGACNTLDAVEDTGLDWS